MGSQGTKKQKDKKRDEQKQSPSRYTDEENKTDQGRNQSSPSIRRNRPHNSKFDRDEREQFDDENRDLGGEG
jgi:hypothetical protein